MMLAATVSEALLREAEPTATDETMSVTLTTTDSEGLEFLQPWKLFEQLELSLRWHMLCLVLSRSSAPFAAAPGRVRAQFLPQEAHELWRGLSQEVLPSDRRPQRAGDDGADVAQNPPTDEAEKNNSSEEEPDFMLEMLGSLTEAAEAAEREQAESSPGSARTSSSGSSSSTSDSDDSDGTGRASAPAMAAGQESATGSAAAPAQALQRDRREETFVWGEHRFLFTFRPPSTFQATCRYHAAKSRTKCTKSCTWLAGAELEKEEAILRLKLWCLKAGEADSRESHQAGRGVPPATAAEKNLSEADLLRMERALPALPPEA